MCMLWIAFIVAFLFLIFSLLIAASGSYSEGE